MSTSAERDARHERQGIQSGTYMFCDILLHSTNAAEARQAVDDAIVRVDKGLAPQTFKSGVRGEMLRLLEHIYPFSDADRTPPRARCGAGK